VLLTLGFAGAEDGVMLCFGSDGHLAIEAVGPEGCAEVIKTAAHAASARAIPVSSSHCGPCVDVALTASTTTKGTSTAKRAGAAATAISIATPRPPISHLRAKIRAQHAVRFISEKPYTVVIRC
jgi:hypothetical protein